MKDWKDPKEIVTLTIKLPRVARARVKGSAALLGITTSELLSELIMGTFSEVAPLQQEWLDGWRAQQESGELQTMFQGEDPRK